MDNDEKHVENKAKMNLKLAQYSFQWMPILGLLAVGLGFLYFFLGGLCCSNSFRAMLMEHPKATIGIPLSGLASLCLVVSLEQYKGDIEFKAIGFEFKGASGPVVLWILAFLSLVTSINILW